MNPRLIKFAVEMQCENRRSISFSLISFLAEKLVSLFRIPAKVFAEAVKD